VTPIPPLEPRSRRQRARALYDRLPTKWLVTAVSAALLGLSAVLGGLNQVAASPVAAIDADSPYESAQLTLTVEGASLIDGFPEQSVTPADGNRLLVVVATVVNTWPDPVRIAAAGGDADSLLPEGVEFADDFTAPSTILVFGDGTQVSTVQPNVPVKLAYVWEVAAGSLADGDELRIDVLDRDYQGESVVGFGDRFSDFRVGGYVTVPLEDLGAGSAG
jgi:hypothetical protein